MTPEQLDALRGHTPGPWERVDNKWDVVSIKKGILICTTYPWDVTGGRIEDNADANLIAAAPDLLAHIDEQQRKIEKMTEALQIIANERQCLNNLMSNREVAAEALKEVGDDT